MSDYKAKHFRHTLHVILGRFPCFEAPRFALFLTDCSAAPCLFGLPGFGLSSSSGTMIVSLLGAAISWKRTK
jgi:hypothetical protein